MTFLKTADGVPATEFDDVDVRLAALDVGVTVVREAPLNVRDVRFGAIGNGDAANRALDSAGFRLATATALAAKSGAIYAPRGLYLVDTTASPLVDVPANQRITLIGDGSGTVGNININGSTVVKRTTGTNPIFRVQGTGDALTTDRGFASAKDIMLWGGDAAGDVVVLKQCNDVDFTNVRIHGALGSLLKCQQLFNSEFIKCYFTAGGTGSATPATVLESASGATAGIDVGGQTVRFVACEWELNTGTDLKVSGSRPNLTPSFGIALIAPKMERQLASATWPILDLDYVKRMQIVGFDISCGGTGNTSRLVTVPVDGPNTAGQGSINFVGGSFSYPVGLSPYAVEQLSGYLSFSGVDFGAMPVGTITVRIGASVDSRGCRIGNCFHLNSITDERAAGFFNVASTAALVLPLIGPHDGVSPFLITGTADITSIGFAGWRGRVVVLEFAGTAATNGLVDGVNLKLAGNFAYTPDDTITLICTGSTWHEMGRSVN